MARSHTGRVVLCLLVLTVLHLAASAVAADDLGTTADVQYFSSAAPDGFSNASAACRSSHGTASLLAPWARGTQQDRDAIVSHCRGHVCWVGDPVVISDGEKT
ncbi:hypothetical protein FOA52_014104 [Chlamydomonas sp. UWO 241]|nr:hypothetical protein FOA52_014104 [Chlamydomonas sp. UWO 241]